MNYSSVAQVGNLYQQWTKVLDFYTEDIDILEKRLTEVGSKNTGTEAKEGVEKFQNAFVSTHQTIFELRKKIERFAANLKIESEKHAGHVDANHRFEKAEIDGFVEDLEKQMAIVRKDFNRFLTEWM